MPKIAISYRRDDTQQITGRIYDRLVTRYGEDVVFRDIDAVDAARDFRQKIDSNFGASEVVVAIIGPQWLGPKPGGSNRIQDERDYVRHEIETGLKREIPVVPVLIDGTRMPSEADLPEPLKAFAYREALQVSSGVDFNVHSSRLIEHVDRILKSRGVDIPQPEISAPSRTPPLIQLMAFIMIAVALIRLSVAMNYREGFVRWLERHPFNYAEFGILICLAPLVALLSLRGGQTVRAASLAICAVGLLDCIYFLTVFPSTTNLYGYAAVYAVGLVIYGFWKPQGRLASR